ncbi:MAG: hypothetical protein H3C58_10090 [Fimbriimonadaceae bacterium]|nr:hypothetical protein [Fimbriimonadaceae bacterium]
MQIATALGALSRPIVAVYEWDSQAHRWKRYVPGVPSFVSNLHQLRTGATYWVIAQ